MVVVFWRMVLAVTHDVAEAISAARPKRRRRIPTADIANVVAPRTDGVTHVDQSGFARIRARMNVVTDDARRIVAANVCVVEVLEDIITHHNI